MQTRLLMIHHASTAAMRSGIFPTDDRIDGRGIAEAKARRAQLDFRTDATVFTSPAACARDTAQALGLTACVAQALIETDYGRWSGQRLSDVAMREPSELAAWCSDPDAAAHGGESVNMVLARVGAWLENLATPGEVVAVTHAAVMRAAILYVLKAPAAAFSHMEIPPLSVVELRRSSSKWTWWPAQAFASLQGAG